jgi:hypothetical protein
VNIIELFAFRTINTANKTPMVSGGAATTTVATGGPTSVSGLAPSVV